MTNRSHHVLANTKAHDRVVTAKDLGICLDRLDRLGQPGVTEHEGFMAGKRKVGLGGSSSLSFSGTTFLMAHRQIPSGKSSWPLAMSSSKRWMAVLTRSDLSTLRCDDSALSAAVMS